jgi:hypothetical protein
MKMKKKTAILLIYMSVFFLAFVSNIAAGANWETISEDNLKGIYIDNDTLRHISETSVTAQFKIIFKEPLWVNLQSIAYYVIKEEHNCEENKYRVHQLIVYYNDGTSAHFDTKEELAVKSDTFQSSIHYFICRKSSIR